MTVLSGILRYHSKVNSVLSVKITELKDTELKQWLIYFDKFAFYIYQCFWETPCLSISRVTRKSDAREETLSHLRFYKLL